MSRKLRVLQLFASIIASIAVAGCTSILTAPAADDTAAAETTGPAIATEGNSGLFNNLVSRDVVSVLTQINELSPASTILGTANEAWRAGDFANALRDELESAGYAIRAAGSWPDTTSMGYSITDSTLNVPTGWSGQSQTVTVIAGDIAVRRTYLIDANGTVSPLGKMQVKGADASALTLRKDIFDVPANTGHNQDVKPDAKPTARPPEQIAQRKSLDSSSAKKPVAYADDLALHQSIELSDVAPPTVFSMVKKPTFLDLVAPSVPVAKPMFGQSLLSTTSETQTQNVMELQQSNFEELFADMGIVNEKVLTFANDSTRMGDANKVRLQRLIEKFQVESDMFSLVGCSLGHTNYAGGQEVLARRRAMRVREELLYAGIPSNNIVEEGCWAEEAFDLRMPRRGVVVTLKRSVS